MKTLFHEMSRDNQLVLRCVQCQKMKSYLATVKARRPVRE